MKKLLLATSLAGFGLGASAQTYQPLTISSGFNADVIANGSGSAALSSTQAVDIANFSLAAQNFVNPSNVSPTNGVPSTGLINSAATPGLSFQLASFTGNNDLRIPASGTGTGTGTGTLILSTPRAADKVYILGLSGNGASTVTITVNFSDGSNQQFAAQTINDWFGGTGFAIQNIGRVNRSTNAIENPAGDPRIYQKELVLSAANKSKLIQSIGFNKTSTTGVLNIFAISSQNTPTGLAKDLLNDEAINVYPNPASGFIKISCPLSKYEIEISDLNGRVIKQEKVDGKETTLDLTTAAKGIYFLKITGEGKTATRKFVVE
jgi:hypothetical protein